MQSNRFLTLINVNNDPNDKMIALIMTLKKLIVNIEEIMHRVILKKKKLFNTITEGAACHLKLHRNCFSPFEKQRRNTHCHFTWFK